jgi:hypothetical protein
MYSGKVFSYKYIVDKVFRDFGFNDDINDEEGSEWLAEFMAHTNVGIVLEKKLAAIKIKDGRGDLPSDLHKIIQTAYVDGVNCLEDIICGKGSRLPMRWATDSFHARFHLNKNDYLCDSRLTYTVGQNFIFPSFSIGYVLLSYDAIPTDEEGYPTIPAEQQWIEAASYYIAYKIAKKLWIRNELTSDKYQVIERDKEWYFAQAVNHSKQWNGVDQAESVKNSHVRTIPNLQDHNTFFANMQFPEQRYFRSKNDSSIITTVNMLDAGENPATN